MKKGIRILMAATLAMVAVNANAQFGINAAYVNSSYREKGSDNYSANGFKVGVHDDLKLVAGLSIRPALNYTFLSSKETRSFSGLDVSGSVKEHYLAVPVDVKYAFGFSDGFKIYAFAGPRFAVGLASKAKLDVNSVLGNGSFTYNMYSGKIKSDDLPDTVVNTINDAVGDGMYSRFDIQLGLGVGVQLFRVLSVEFGYDWGLMNRYKGDMADDYTMKRNQLYVGLGLTF